MKVGLASVALAMTLGSAAVAAAEQPCPVEGEPCEVERLQGTCIRDEGDQLSCLADATAACLDPSASCVVFEVEAGDCRPLQGGNVCVPRATDAACANVALGGACVLPSGSAGLCVPSNGLLGCVEDADGCLVAAQDSSCDTADGVRGWCRTRNDGAWGCTTECGDDPEGFCRDAAGALGSCDESSSGDVVCVADPSLCAAEGDPCQDGSGQENTCRAEYGSAEGEVYLHCGDECGGCPAGQECVIDGGAGDRGCREPGDDSSSGCCLGSQETVANDRYRGPATMVLSAVAMTLMGRRKRRGTR